MSNSLDRAEHTRPAAGQTGAGSFRLAINVLTSVLLVVSLVGIVGHGRRESFVAVGLTALFALVYAAGMIRGNKGPYRLWQRIAWLAALTIVWAAMMAVLPVAVYMVFPLFFLYLEALPDVRGIFAVVGAAVIAVFSQWPHLTVGAVMGPAVSAAVVIGIHMALQRIWQVTREREELIQELISTRSALAETERAAGIAAERQRIAHEIHDTLAQGLSSIQMLIRVVEQDIQHSGMPEEQRRRPLDRLELARQTAADNLGEARAMIAALQPAALSKTSLEGALQRVAQHITGPEVTISVEGDDRQLPMSTEAALLRIAQGALGNVQKHSQASRCHVTLTYGDDEIRLDIVDDGHGFDPERQASRPAGLGHIGIDAMRQRAQEQDGQLVVESAPGEGCALSVSLPVEQPAAREGGDAPADAAELVELAGLSGVDHAEGEPEADERQGHEGRLTGRPWSWPIG